MPRRRTPLSAFLAIWLAGCATSGEAPAPVVETPLIPAVPADVLACARGPVTPPDRELDAGEVEKLWKTDRAALARVNGCLRRLVCQYQDLRAEIGKIETATCVPAAPPPRKKLLGHLRYQNKVAAQ
jgi:hypothetical protein